jgi:hypothetical protein
MFPSSRNFVRRSSWASAWTNYVRPSQRNIRQCPTAFMDRGHNSLGIHSQKKRSQILLYRKIQPQCSASATASRQVNEVENGHFTTCIALHAPQGGYCSAQGRCAPLARWALSTHLYYTFMNSTIHEIMQTFCLYY